MTLNPDLVLDCVLRQHVWSSEAWLSKHMVSLILVRNVVGELQRKRTLAASRGFLAAARLSCFTLVLVGRITENEQEIIRNTFVCNGFFSYCILFCACVCVFVCMGFCLIQIKID